jgi:hypothetical protein
MNFSEKFITETVNGGSLFITDLRPFTVQNYNSGYSPGGFRTLGGKRHFHSRLYKAKFFLDN